MLESLEHSTRTAVISPRTAASRINRWLPQLIYGYDMRTALLKILTLLDSAHCELGGLATPAWLSQQ